MSYLVLARKYRPASFDTVSGQEHVTRTLMNAIKRDKVGHAFLFTGPRGVGKTSVARIFSRGLNCEKGATHNPCLTCTNCVEIGNGISMAVREIDGASHNSVDNVRELIESFRSPPAPGYRYKVYIIDEVHMLSTAAFNALLKSLEEPPPFTIFILATTEVHKIPQTVISRCQRHDFRALSIESISGRLAEICKAEKVSIDDEAIRMLARLADGSMRDSQSLLERVQSYTDKTITAADVGTVLGIVERGILLKMIEAVIDQKPADALRTLHATLSTGLDIGIFLREFVTVWRELLVVQTLQDEGAAALGVLDAHRTQMKSVVSRVNALDLQDLVHLAREGADSALRSSYPKYVLEALIVRLATREPMGNLSQLLQGTQGGAVTPPKGRAANASSVQQQVQSEVAPVREEIVPVPQNQSTGAPVAIGSWESFVELVDQKKNKIFAEHLKRLSVSTFTGGALEARGPEFTVNYMLRKDTNDQLLGALREFSQVADWRIKIVCGEKIVGAEPGSIAETVRVTRQQLADTRKEDILNHPVVKGLQKLFPGTEIEKIKIHEN